jgi:cytochrome c oxidase subunit 1
VQAGGADHPAGDGAIPGHAIHLPSPSYWPLVASLGLPIMAYGVIYSWWVVGAGVVVALIGFYGWALEPSVAE